MSSISILALFLNEIKKRFVLSSLSGTNQDALQALFGDDVTACFGKRVFLEPTPMRVAGRELVVIRLKAAPATNGTGPKAATGEKTKADAPAEESGPEAGPEAMASG